MNGTRERKLCFDWSRSSSVYSIREVCWQTYSQYYTHYCALHNTVFVFRVIFLQLCTFRSRSLHYPQETMISLQCVKIPDECFVSWVWNIVFSTFEHLEHMLKQKWCSILIKIIWIVNWEISTLKLLTNWCAFRGEMPFMALSFPRLSIKCFQSSKKESKVPSKGISYIILDECFLKLLLHLLLLSLFKHITLPKCISTISWH